MSIRGSDPRDGLSCPQPSLGFVEQVAPYLINATLLGVVGQRLVRTLCPRCKQPKATRAEVWENLIQGWKFPPPEQLYQPEGCPECRNTGYQGRVGIYEILRMDSAVKEQVKRGFDIDLVHRLARKQGMEPLRISGARKVHAGSTTVEEVLRVAPVERDG